MKVLSNSLRIIIASVAIIILGGCDPKSTTGNFTVEADSIYAKEADAFIASGATKGQAAQTEAIRKAIAEDSEALNAIRNGRSKKDYVDGRVAVNDSLPNIRIYTPSGEKKRRPVLLYLHGGGWCFGSIKSCSRFCTELCVNADIVIAALDYRLAPENPYPSAINDCVDAIKYLSAHADELGIDTTRISIGGDSSGGNLAIVSALKSENSIHSLLLFYPVTNVSKPYGESWQTYGEGYANDAEIMEAFTDAYIPQEQRAIGLVSPLNLNDDELKRLPNTLLVAAERDVLYDQGKSFIHKLHDLKVPAQHITINGSVHLFITVPGQDAAFYKSVELAKDFLAIQ